MILTNRLVIRSLEERDYSSFLEVQTDEQARKYLGGVVNEEKVKTKFAKMLCDTTSNYFVVTKNSEVIGIITIGKHVDDKSSELSYQFIPRFWGKGYALESIQAILKLIKDEYCVHSVIAETQSANEKSISLLLKLGMVLEKEVVRFSENQSIYRLNL